MFLAICLFILYPVLIICYGILSWRVLAYIKRVHKYYIYKLISLAVISLNLFLIIKFIFDMNKIARAIILSIVELMLIVS